MDPAKFYGCKESKRNSVKTRIIRGQESDDALLSDSEVDKCILSDTDIAETILSENYEFEFNSEDGIPLLEIAQPIQKPNDEIIWISEGARKIRPICPWQGQLTNLPDKLLTPFVYFSKFVDKNLLDHLVE